MSAIVFKDIKKQYDNAKVPTIEHFNLSIDEGEFVAFVGPSGCGKTTTLRMLAGLEDISGGEILIDNKVINKVQPRDRGLAMVFQNYALYPHKTVYKNISFGLKMNKVPKNIIDEKVQWAVDILNIKDQLNKKPKDLSGGQRQRVALARAIVKDSKVFLMDEPLSNLDAKLRVSTRSEIKKLHKKLESTFIYVTHDQIEAMTMADKIVVMDKGNIMQVGTPKELYNDPDNIFVATFIGTPQMNNLDVTIKDGTIKIDDNLSITIPSSLEHPLKEYDNKKVTLGIRPEDLATSMIELETYEDYIISIVCETSELIGKNYYIHSYISDKKVIVDTIDEIKDNGTFKVAFKPHKIMLFDKDTGDRIR